MHTYNFIYVSIRKYILYLTSTVIPIYGFKQVAAVIIIPGGLGDWFGRSQSGLALRLWRQPLHQGHRDAVDDLPIEIVDLPTLKGDFP